MTLPPLRCPALALFLAATLSFSAAACPPDDASHPPLPIGTPDMAKAVPSVEQLRAQGPAGLKTLLDEYDRDPTANAANTALLAKIDAVAAQKDAAWSRLYWYTDLDAAKAAARGEGGAQHKPILYLRLMGKLTDEYSCANSRFFRTALYANTAVSQLLREQFVLVWGSERPVPVVTIDYGDGRVLKRTITGNSAHYVLDADGRVVDVLPGLFDPAAFAAILTDAAQAAATNSPDAQKRYAQRREDSLLRQWKDESQALVSGKNKQVAKWVAADAAAAGKVAFSKRAMENPLLSAISPDFAAEIVKSTTTADDATWAKVAALHPAKLDDHSIALMRSQNPGADDAALAKTVAAFQKTMADDTVHNNFILRRQALAWLKDAPASGIALEDLNARVYDELFLTPHSDPWLGLAQESTYSALGNNGCCDSK